MGLFRRTKSKKNLQVFTLAGGDGGDGSEQEQVIGATGSKIKKDVGRGLSSSVLMAPSLWISRQISEPPLITVDLSGNEILDHELTQLINEPNQYYSGTVLAMATGLELAMTGNVYIEIDRDNLLKPESLYYLSSFTVEPKGSIDKLVTYYEHTIYVENKGPVKRKILPQDMIHIRLGIDPVNQKKGISPLQILLREIFTDEEASKFTAAILMNQGFPGIVISPKDPDTTIISETEAGKLKDYFKRAFSGNRRGDAVVINDSLTLSTLQIDLGKLNVDSLRKIPEERICSVLGIPSAVVGFGSGLEQTKVAATMAELREQAFENAVIPLMKLQKQEYTKKLVPDYDVTNSIRISHDLTDVRVLQEDQDKLTIRVERQFKSNIITRAEARIKIGLAIRPEDDVYYYQLVEVTEDDGEIED